VISPSKSSTAKSLSNNPAASQRLQTTPQVLPAFSSPFPLKIIWLRQ
jgi:hypothetical protein